MKKVLFALIAIVVMAALVGAYIWFKPHRDIRNEQAVYEFQANELALFFAENEAEANATYLDKVIVVEGDAIKIADDHILMTEGIYCSGDFAGSDIQEGDRIWIKGRVVSYDDLFREVRLDQCILSNQ